MFIKIGERINSSRKPVARALAAKDETFIKKEAAIQKDAGAQMLDINCAFNSKDEAFDIEWAIRTAQGETGLPVSIDSPNPEAIEAGLKIHKGKALVNSITLEKNKAEAILPIVKKYGAQVIILTMDESGMPSTAEERAGLAGRALELSKKHGIAPEDIYIDPLVRAISSEAGQGIEVIESVRLIKSRHGLKTICGLSNISFGLPERSTLNAVFLSMMLISGLSAAILDPTNKRIRASLKASAALLGRDEYCKDYIKSFREGLLV
ncbi:MAG: dihydropteroate synthase [Candidatus Omnitrophica bacterium]|nr:dihydropteroate synthase [Candidatus Omnitrophota bacterium]